MWDNVTVLEEHTSGTALYTSSRWYTPGKFWYTLGCTIHPVDKHCPSGFSGLGIATNSALLQIFGILSWPMQELRKSQNQDLRVDPAWSMNSGKMESNPGDFPGFRRLKAAATFSGLEGSDILWPSGVGIFHWSNSSLLTSLVDSRSLVLCAPFFKSWEAMEFAETGTAKRIVQTWQ